MRISLIKYVYVSILQFISLSVLNIKYYIHVLKLLPLVQALSLFQITGIIKYSIIWAEEDRPYFVFLNPAEVPCQTWIQAQEEECKKIQ